MVGIEVIVFFMQTVIAKTQTTYKLLFQIQGMVQSSQKLNFLFMMENRMEQDLNCRMITIVYEPALKAMGGNRGKLSAQTGHAWLHAFWDAEEFHPERAKLYKYSGMAKKVTLKCDDETLMRELVKDYRALTGGTIVEDAGLTVFNGQKTFTCVGIGPLHLDEQDERLKGLKVLI